ncbi:MAG: hypothetical protein K2F85_08910 [Helicobacter sp.]|nr:hypothetical protein [Helicobacter sp.]
MTKMIILQAFVLATLFCGCEYQRRITAAEIGCPPKDITFPDGESWIVPEYWEATCYGKKYACRPTMGLTALFDAQNATCSVISNP